MIDYLDPKLVLRLDDDLLEQPIFDDLFRETIKAGSEMIPDLWRYLDECDLQRHRAPEDATETFSIVCPHGIPVEASCWQCEEGISPSQKATQILEGLVLESRRRKPHKLSLWQRLKFYIYNWGVL